MRIFIAVFTLMISGIFCTAIPAQAQRNVKPIVLPTFAPPDPDAAFPCRNKPFSLTLGGTVYKVRRLESLQYLPVGALAPVTSNENSHPARDCAVESGGNVASFTTGFVHMNDVSLTLSLPPADARDAPPSTYSRNKENIEIADRDRIFFRRPYGAERAVIDNVEFYRLSTAAAPTKSGEPVVVYCSIKKAEQKETANDGFQRNAEKPKNLCKAAYQMPDGLYVDYYFLHDAFKTDLYPSVDKMVRDRIAAMRAQAAPSAAANTQAVPTPNP